MAGRRGGSCGHRGAVFDVLYRPGALYFAVIGLQLRDLWAAQKQVRVSSAVSVAAEALVMSPLAVGYILWLESSGQGTFASEGTGHALLLVSAGLITALPLLCFAEGARTLRLSTIGMLQYLTPIMQMLWALFVTHEHFSTHRWIGFGIIGLAVAIYVVDLVRMPRSA